MARTSKPAPTPELLIAQYPPAVQALVQALRAAVHAAAPGAGEKANLGWRSINFSDPHVGYFVGLFPFADHVRVIFEFGVLLPDPDGVLDGEGLQVRWLTLRPETEPPLTSEATARLQQWIAAALALPPDRAARLALVAERSAHRPG